MADTSSAQTRGYPDPALFDAAPEVCPYCIDAREQIGPQTSCNRPAHSDGEGSRG